MTEEELFEYELERLENEYLTEKDKEQLKKLIADKINNKE